jgi:hypothetical protein
MNTFETLTVGEKTYNLKITTARAVKLEGELGGDLLAKTEKLAELGTLAKYYFAALASFNDDIVTIEDVYQLFDDYILKGGTFEELQLLMMRTLVVSGVLTQKAFKICQEAAEKQKKALEKLTDGQAEAALNLFLNGMTENEQPAL